MVDLTSFLKKLSGIRWFIIIDQSSGTVKDKSTGLPEEYVPALMAISKYSFDLTNEASKYIVQTTGETGGRTVFVKFDGEGLEIDVVRDSVVVTNIDFKLLDQLPKVMDYLKRGENVKCKKCGYDLTLETAACGKCGRTIPFIAEKCPFCGNDTSVKKCPNHGGYVLNNGDLVKGDVGLLMLLTIVGFAVLATSLLASIIIEALRMPLIALGIIAAGLMTGLGALTYRRA